MMETIDLDIEEVSELLFKVKVEGLDPAPAKVRLVCETDDGAMMFNGHPTTDDGIVRFQLPVLNGKLKEGLHASRVEVLIENRYFAPVQFNINLKKAARVVAESVQVVQRRVEPTVTVTAAPIVKKVEKPVVQAKPITLRERYKKKASSTDDENEELIRELARSFVKKK